MSAQRCRGSAARRDPERRDVARRAGLPAGGAAGRRHDPL